MYIIGIWIYIVCTIHCSLFQLISLLYGRFLCRDGGLDGRFTGADGGTQAAACGGIKKLRHLPYALAGAGGEDEGVHGEGAAAPGGGAGSPGSAEELQAPGAQQMRASERERRTARE